MIIPGLRGFGFGITVTVGDWGLGIVSWRRGAVMVDLGPVTLWAEIPSRWLGRRWW